MRYLGIDWGEKRIGLALGDSETRLATPFKVVGSLDELLAVISAEKADALVIGQPTSLSGEKPSNERAEAFTEELRLRSKLPVSLIDERLSSKAADAFFGDKKNKAPRDAVAAMVILQTFLDGL